MAAIDADTVFENYWRTCDICGNPRTRAQITVRDNIAICSIHPGFRTARELDNINARRKPIRIRPVRGEKPLPMAPTYLVEEAAIFDLVTSVAPFETRDVASDGAGGITGVRSYQAIGWAILYLLAVYTEGRRPLAWRTQALAKARELGDLLISKQVGNGIAPSFTPATSQVSGGLSRFDLGGTTDVIFYAIDQGLACVAWCRLFTATGAEKYRYAAGLSANMIVNLMAGDLLVSGPTSSFYGPPTDSYDFIAGTYDHTYTPSGLVCLWGLTLLKTIAGDGTYGAPGSAGGFFTSTPARLLSAAISQIRSFWANGAFDSTTGTTFTGLSAATPRVAFNASSASWSVGGVITSADWATALRSLFETEGVSDQVTDCHGYLASIAHNPSFSTAAGASAAVITRSATGTYDPSVAPPTFILVSTGQNASSFYDYGAAGLLAPIQSARAPSRLDALKEILATPRPRYLEGSPRDSRTESLGRLGRSGLSFQPYTSTGVRQESVTRAAQVGFLYRYRQAFGGDE